MGKKVFSGCHFCLTGKLSQLRKVVVEYVESNGGVVHSSVTGAVGYLICSQADMGTSKCMTAKGFGTKCIKEQYLYDCVAKGTLLDTAKYEWDDDGGSGAGSDTDDMSDAPPPKKLKVVKKAAPAPAPPPAASKAKSKAKKVSSEEEEDDDEGTDDMEQDADADASDTEAESDQDDGDDRKACPYGLKCYRKNPQHFAEEKHPTSHPSYVAPKKKKVVAGAADGKSPLPKSSVDKTLERAELQQYKDIVRKAVQTGKISAEQKRTMRDFRTEKNISKQEHLSVMQQFGWTAEEYEDGEKKMAMMLPEEKLLLDSADGFGIITLKKSDNMTSAQQAVFAQAATKFYQTMAKSQAGFTVEEVGIVVNRKSRQTYADAKSKLAAAGIDTAEEWGFHGTGRDAIHSICKTGFLHPDEFNKAKGVKVSALDSGFFGKGIYFSFYSDYSMYYSRLRGSDQLLLVKVMRGNCFHCKKRMDGQKPKAGVDSHFSPKGNELIVFSPANILPTFIITFKEQPTAAF